MFSNKKKPVQEEKTIDLLDDSVGDDAIEALSANNDNLDDLDLALENATLNSDKVAKLNPGEADWDDVETPMNTLTTPVGLDQQENESDKTNVGQENADTDTTGSPEIPQHIEPVVKGSKSKNDTTKLKTNTHWGVKASFVGVLLVVGGIAALGLVNHQQYRTELTELFSQSSSSQLLINSTAGKQVELAEAINLLTQTTADFKNTQTRVQQSLDSLSTSINEIKISVQNNNTAIAAQQEELVNMGSRITTLETGLKLTNDKLSGQVSDIRKTLDKQAKAPTVDPVFNTANTVGDATLESVDLWNNEQYVNLRKPTGIWIPLKVSETYQGWSVVQIKGDKVTFSKSGKNKVLTVKS